MKPIDQLIELSTTDELTTAINKYSKGKLSVVMFTASFCGPCKSIKKEIYNDGKGLSVDYKNKVNFFYIDIEKNPDLASEFGIASIPTFYFMIVNNKDVEFVVEKISGGNKNKLVDCIEKALKKL